MREHGFSRTLAFGAVAALSLVFFQHAAAGRLAGTTVAVVHVAACLVAYAALLGHDPRSRLARAAMAALGAVVTLLVAGTTSGVWLGLGIVLAGVRSGSLTGGRRLRGLLFEAALVGLGLVVAFWLGGPSWLEQAAGLWGFALIQSLYFLAPESATDARPQGERDPFDQALERLGEILDES